MDRDGSRDDAGPEGGCEWTWENRVGGRLLRISEAVTRVREAALAEGVYEELRLLLRMGVVFCEKVWWPMWCMKCVPLLLREGGGKALRVMTDQRKSRRQGAGFRAEFGLLTRA